MAFQKRIEAIMRNCRTSKIDGEIEIYRTGDPEFDPEPTTLCYVNT